MTRAEQLPPLRVLLDGRPLEAAAEAALRSIVVSQLLCLPVQCEASFCLQGRETGSLSTLVLGMPFSVGCGSEAQELFEGELTAIERCCGADGRQVVVLRSYDLLHRLRKRQQLRQFDDLSVAALAEMVVGDLGLQVCVHGPDVRLRQVVQWQQSDLALLCEVGQRHGCYFSLRKKTLHLFPLSGAEDSPVQLDWGKNLLKVHVELSTEPACRSVEVLGWNPQLAEAVEGAAIWFDDAATRTGPSQAGVSGERFLAGQALGSSEEAAMLGQAMLDRRKAGEAVLHGVAQGSPLLRPGASVKLGSVADDANGLYVLTKVVHRLDRLHGYLSEVDTSPPAVQPKQRIHCSLGVVLDVDDPDRHGRIKVALPGLGQLESLWLEVVHPGAGAEKGLVALPDVDDKVLVLFVDGEPSQGVVLGGLYGQQGPPCDGVHGGRVRQYTFTTSMGQQLSLDDATGTVRLGSRDGSHVTLSPDKLVLHANSDVVVEAPGRRMLFRANEIDFEQIP